MIDTIKISVDVCDELLEVVKSQSVETKRINHVENSTGLNYYNCPIFLPSYWRGVNIFHDYYKKKLYFELSLPKFIYNHNIKMITAEEAMQACVDLYKIFTEKLGHFPKVDQWEVTRIDYCYSWACKTREDVLSLFGVLRTYDYPRKKGLNFGTSIYASSQLSTVKFYLKGDEFRKHDYSAIKKFNYPLAQHLYSVSSNILRFEIELRKRQLSQEFAKNRIDVYTVFDTKNIIRILNKYLGKFTGTRDMNISNNNEIYKRLLKYCKTDTKAIQLFEFFKLLHSPILEDREFLKSSYHRSTIYRKKKELNNAGVGLPINDNLFPEDFELTIPSKNNVNKYLISCDSASDATQEKEVGLLTNSPT